MQVEPKPRDCSVATYHWPVELPCALEKTPFEVEGDEVLPAVMGI